MGPQHRLRGGAGGGGGAGRPFRKPAKAPRQLPPQSRSQRLRQRSDRSAVRFPAFPPQDAQRWGPSPRLPSRGCSFNPSFKMIVPCRAAAHARAYLRFPTAALGADRAPWGRASGETRPFDAHLLAQEVACQGRTVRGEFTPREGGRWQEAAEPGVGGAGGGGGGGVDMRALGWGLVSS
uniref:Uncharacterized protein n=1 Tax=Rousettus aegyptiacus TaxID=9407 RepID=A0A7J8GB21_ROUAE|nr:hypothetical protein HJG63_011783 [Rousettus aegyptiacus]